jgi:5'-methylthioadenosine phosphorylase
VSVEAVIKVLMQNVERAKRIIRDAAGRLPAERQCKCGQALTNAILTRPDAIPPATAAKLDLLIGKYLPRTVSGPNS